MTRDELRRKLLQQRADIPAAERKTAAVSVAERVVQRLTTDVQPPTAVAIFKSFAAELDTQATIDALWQQQILTVLPVLHPFNKGQLLFLRYHADTAMRPNKYGISEPVLACHQVVPLQAISHLLMPLVGFDDHGNRLGMGGGYYDRTLASWQQGLLPNLQPIGLAFDQQYNDHIPVEPWDIAIPEIITPSRHWQFALKP